MQEHQYREQEQDLVLQALLLTVPRLVDDLHLLDYGALAGLAGPQQQQLDLPAGLLPVHGQLPVDLPAPLGRLLLQAAHCTPHGAGLALHSSPLTTTPSPPSSLHSSLPLASTPSHQLLRI